MRWRLKNYGEFDTCSFYGVLRGPFVPIPWKGILGVKVPRRVSSLFGRRLGEDSYL